MSRPATETVADEPAAAAVRQQRLRFEMIFASLWVAIGLFAVPAVIFAVGSAVLGPYGEDGGLGRFYGDFFADLAEPSVRAWALALGPLLLVTLVRLVFIGAGRRPDEPPSAPAAQPRRTPEDARRIEPRVSID